MICMKVGTKMDKKSQSYYQNDKAEGLYETWRSNGRKIERVNYQNGEKHGLHEIFKENGKNLNKLS